MSNIYQVYKAMNSLMVLRRISKKDAIRHVVLSYKLTKKELEDLIRLAF